MNEIIVVIYTGVRGAKAMIEIIGTPDRTYTPLPQLYFSLLTFFFFYITSQPILHYLPISNLTIPNLLSLNSQTLRFLSALKLVYFLGWWVVDKIKA